MNPQQEIQVLKDQLEKQNHLLQQYQRCFDQAIFPNGVMQINKHKECILVDANDKLLEVLNIESTVLPFSLAKIMNEDALGVIDVLSQLSLETNRNSFKYFVVAKDIYLYFKRISHDQYLISAEKNKTNLTAKVEKRLKVSEERFRLIFQNAPIAIVLINKEIQPVLSNMQFCHMTGYSNDEIISMGLRDFTHPDDVSKNLQLYDRLFDAEISNFTLIKRYIRKDKKIIWVKVTVSAIHDNGIKPTTAIVMVQDITAEKQATAELIKSEYKYRTLIENANDGIGLFDENFKAILYNTSLYEVLGFDLDDYLKIDHSKYELFHPDDVEDARRSFEAVKLGKKSRIEKRLRGKDGLYRYFSISYIPVVHDDKPAALIFRRDISKRKEAEAQNEEYRLFLETLMDNLPVSLFAKTTPDFRYLYWNKTLENLSGIPADDAIGQSDFEIMQFRKEAQNYYDEDKKLLKSGGKLESEYDFTNAVGERKRFKSIKTVHKPSVGNPMILGISVDVTQLHNAETLVEQSSQMLREAQKIAKLGYWEYDVSKDLIFDNVENRQILGIQKLSYFLNIEQFMAIIHTADVDAVRKNFQTCINEKVVGESIMRINVGKELKYISVNYRPLSNEEGEVVKVRGTTIDITRIKQSEIALKESEYKLKQAEHIAKVGYWNYDYKKDETQFSDEVWNLLELKDNQQKISFIDFFHNVHPDDKLLVNTAYQKSKKTNKPFDFDFRIITAKKNIKYIKAKGTFVINSDRVAVRSIGTFQDITKLKEKEIELEHNTSHLVEVQKLSKTGYIEMQFDTSATVFSETIWDIVNLKKGTLKTPDEFNLLIHENDRETIIKTIENTLKNEASHNIQYRIQLKDGSIKYINEICIFGSHENPNRQYATRVIQDITQIKQKDIALEKSAMSLKEVAKSGVLGTWEYNIDKDRYFISDELQSILQIGKQSKALRFKQMIGLIHPEDRYSVRKVLLDCFAKKENYTLSYRIVDKSLVTIKHIQDNGRFIENEKGHWKIFGVIRDITEINEAKIELSESNELLKIMVENSLFATLLFKNGKHVYLNEKWSRLIGISKHEALNSSIEDIFEQETVDQINGLFEDWDNFKIDEYSNKMHLQPKNAANFFGEVYVKEVFVKNERLFLILVYDVKE